MTVYAPAGDARDALVAAAVALPEHVLAASLGEAYGGATLEDVLLAMIARDQRSRLALGETLDAVGWQPSAAVRHLRWAPIARGRMEAALLGVPDTLLDGRPFPGEWSVRQQLAHVELTDVRYTIATRYAMGRSDADPLQAPPELYPVRQGDPTGTPGEPLRVILARMRRVRAEAIAPLLSIDEAALLRSTEWHTAEHTIGFRLHRFGAHDLELVTDIERTLAGLGYRPGRTVALAAALRNNWAETESLLLGVPAAPAAATPPGGASVRAQLAALAAADQDVLALVNRAIADST